MARRVDGPAEGQGLGWADQWDYKYNDANKSDHAVSTQTKTKKEKLAEVNKKMKAVASTGFAKAKVAATVGAQKVKSGSSAGVKWMKEQYEKRKNSSK